MIQRILTSVIGLAVFFAVLFSNTSVFFAAVAIIILIALFEIHKANSTERSIAIISLISAMLIFFAESADNIILAIIISMMLYMTASVFLHGRYSFRQIYSIAFYTYFITLCFKALIRIRMVFGAEAVLLVFLFAWITDTGAYFAGRFFGKHKLIPNVSPKKTVEGAVGGVVLTLICSCVYLAVLKNFCGIENIGGASYIGMSVLAVIASVLSQIGDLAASAVKRDCNVKDFGTILPGHGGIMDRFDSVVFIAPVVLYYFIYFNKWLG